MTETVPAAWREIEAVERSTYVVDGKEPRLIAEPASLEEAAEVLRGAAEEGLAVIPRGSGTKMGLGNVPRAADLVLLTRGLAGILDYTPADLTITVRAGTRLADLQEALGKEGQFLALDPPGARATVGGVIAANASGPRRLRYGAARDLVIGVRVAQCDGNVTKAGAKVVKNVAGYDLNKLYVGSLGTLVVLGEVNFKLTPLPELYRTLVCPMPGVEAAMAVVRRILHSPLSPTALELVNGAAAAALPRVQGYSGGGRGVLLVAEVDGFAKGVARQLRDVETYAREAGASDALALDEEEARALWEDLREVGTRLAAGATPERGEGRGGAPAVALKVAAPVAAVAALVAAAEEAWAADADGATAAGPWVVSHAGSGIIYVYTDGAGRAGDAAVAAITALREAAVRAGGSLVVERCPTALKSALDVWGEVGPALGVMRRLKATFDPKGILNPGRFVGGI